MHRWHHSRSIPDGFNYSTKLAIWDWIFGTAYLPKGQKPASYGLSGGVWFPEEKGWRGALLTYFYQAVYAFRRFEPAKAEPEAKLEQAAAE